MKNVLKGKIKTIPYFEKELYENLEVIVYNIETKSYINVEKLSHITDYQWVTYSGITLDETTECHYMVVEYDNNTYLVKENQWANYLTQLNTEVSFELSASTFKSGTWMLECTKCSSDFIGHRYQGICENCAEENKIAKILFNKDKLNKKIPIFTNEKKLTISQAIKLANSAFDIGRYSKTDFNDWLSKQEF